MNERTTLADLVAAGRLTEKDVETWSRVADRLAALTLIAREGATVVVKADGERAGFALFTVVVSGGRLGDDFFRRDASDLDGLLDAAIRFYCDRVWSHPRPG
jgi:hypothetical protein